MAKESLTPLATCPRLLATHWMIGALLVVTFWLRAPLLTAGLPYFSQEDEAHHFNRIMEMVKSGDLNPHYFHKPSLHFYLRLPFVAAAALKERRSGAIESVKEIRTRDQYGVGGYAFSASHPSTVKYARLCSLLFGIGTIVCAYWITFALSGCRWGSLIAASIASFSPEAVRYSTTIGVDGVMTFFVTAAALAAVLTVRKYSLTGIVVVALLAGLAVSSKYNALPIFLVPVALWYVAGSWSVTEVLAAFLLPWVAFALASPFIVSSLPLVIDHLGYELWHYGVAGHDGHSAEPGFAQLFFYGKWLVTDGGGVLPVVGALLGLYFFAKRRSKEEVIALLFPLCFLLLMVGQRANFTRNMIALIPFLGILAGCGVHSLLSQLRLGSTLPKIVPWVVVLIMAQPLIVSVRERAATINAPESRIELGTWLHSHQSPTVEFAVAGQLQVASEIRAISGVSIVNEVGLNARDVILNGITYVITSSRFVPPPGEETLWSKIHTIKGTPERQRIVDNPEIAIYKLTPSESYLTQLGASVASSPSLRLPVVLERGKDGALALTAQCDEVDSGEDRCWIKTRYTLLSLSIGEETRLNPRSQELVNISLPVYSPWRPQEMTLTAQGTTSTCAFGLTAASDWNVCTLSLPESVLAAKSSILVTVAAISSPASRGVNSDQRRLGVAIKRKAQ